MMIAHGFGREAIILSRSQYEYFTKLLYYDHDHVEAKRLLDLLNSYSLRFAESVNADIRSGLSEEASAELEKLSKAAYRGNFTAIVRDLERDPLLQRSADEGNPFAKGFLLNAASMLTTHWTYGSSIVHAGIENLPHVLVPDSDGNFTVTIDSRMKAPNKTVLDVT